MTPYAHIVLPSPSRFRRLVVQLELIEAEIGLSTGVWAIGRHRDMREAGWKPERRAA